MRFAHRAGRASPGARSGLRHAATIAFAAMLVAGCQGERRIRLVGDESAASARDHKSVRHLALSDSRQADAARVALADGRLSQQEADQIFAETMADIDRELGIK